MKQSEIMKTFILSILIALPILGQSNYPLTIGAPPPVQAGSASVVGTGLGTQTYAYFVIARYPVGNAVRSPAFVANMAANTLSMSNFVRISWNGQTLATGYDVVRLTGTTTFPVSGTCTNCLIVSNSSATTYNDQSNASLGNYTPVSVGGATANTFFENASQPLPAITHTAGQPTTERWLDTIGVDLSQARTTKPAKVITTLPTTCAIGEQYFLSTGSPGGQLYLCGPINTLTQVAGSGGSIPVTTIVLKGNGAGGAAVATATDVSAVAYCGDSGVSDAYACNLTPSPISYTTGTCYAFIPNTSNTGPATINFNGIGAVALTKNPGHAPLTTGDIIAFDIIRPCYSGFDMQIGGSSNVSPNGSGVNCIPVSTSGAVAINFATAGPTGVPCTDIEVTLTGAITSLALTNGTSRLSVTFIQGAVGFGVSGLAVNLLNWCPVSSVALKYTIQNILYDGTNYNGNGCQSNDPTLTPNAPQYDMVKTSAAVVTIGGVSCVASPCVTSQSNVPLLTNTTGHTATLSGTSNNGTLLFYVTSGGVFSAGHNTTTTVTPQAGLTVATGIAAFPADACPLWAVTWTANVFDAIVPATMLKGNCYNMATIAAGTNVTTSTDPTTGIKTVNVAGGGLTVGTTAIAGGATTQVLYDNAGTLGEYVVSGTGSVCMTITCVMTSTLTNTQGTLAGASTPAYTHTATWNNGATNFVDDFRNITKTAAAVPSYVIQWQVGGSNVLTLDVNGTLVAGLGISAGSTITSGFNLNAAAGAAVCVLASTCFDAPSNGVMRLSNNAQTDFTRLQLGGTTSSFPSIKRSGTTTAFRLADDSADSPITASGATLSGATVVLSGLGAASGTPNSLCLNTTTVTVNAALTCTVSSRDFKTEIAPLTTTSPIDLLMHLAPVEFAYKDHTDRMRWGFIAEDIAHVDTKLADGWDALGIPRSLDQNAILALAIRVIQEQQARIEALEARK